MTPERDDNPEEIAEDDEILRDLAYLGLENFQNVHPSRRILDVRIPEDGPL